MIANLANDELPQLVSPRAIELMQIALQHPPGIKIIARDQHAALKLRRQMYGARRRSRAYGETGLDGLSITVHGSQVRLIVRDMTLSAPLGGIEKIQQLHITEVPVGLGSRGPARPGVIAALMIDALTERGP